MKNLLLCNRSKLRIANSMVCVFFVANFSAAVLNPACGGIHAAGGIRADGDSKQLPSQLQAALNHVW